MGEDLEERMYDLLWRTDEGDTVVTSVRQPTALREATRIAVQLGMDATPNDAAVRALRERVEVFAQRRALEAHYERHPEARPSLAELALAAAEMDGDPLAAEPALLEQAAREVVALRPDAGPDDVLLYAAALHSRTRSA
jgi:hypothetical protein